MTPAEKLLAHLQQIDAKLDYLIREQAKAMPPELQGPPYSLKEACEVGGFTDSFLYRNWRAYGGAKHGGRVKFDRAQFHSALRDGPASAPTKLPKRDKPRPRRVSRERSPDLLPITGKKAA